MTEIHQYALHAVFVPSKGEISDWDKKGFVGPHVANRKHSFRSRMIFSMGLAILQRGERLLFQSWMGRYAAWMQKNTF